MAVGLPSSGTELSALGTSLFFSALGAALSYSKWGRKKLKVYYLSDILDVFELSPRVRVLTEFGLFIIVGCSVCIGIVHPQTAAQAFSAGLGWTSLIGKVK
jgi:hypothetical protein